MKHDVMIVVGFVFLLIGCGGGQTAATAPAAGADEGTEPTEEAASSPSEETESAPQATESASGEAETAETTPETTEAQPEEEVKEASEARITDKHIVISGKILFETGNAKLKKVSYEVLDEVVYAMQKHPEIIKLQVVGHTDSDGDAKANKRLSKRRATAVMKYLVREGIEKDRLSSLGEGENVPIASNDTEEGKDKNRRVEFVIVERVPIMAVTHTTTTAGGGKTDSRKATADETEALIEKEGIKDKLR